MTSSKRIVLNPAKVLGLKHLSGVKGEKKLVAQAMVGYKAAVGYKAGRSQA